MPNGWIKLHRKIVHNAIWKRSAYAHLWVTLLLKANHKDETYMWDKGIIVVKEGQLHTGRLSLSRETGIPEGTIETIMNFLEREGFIQQQKTTKFRVITIVNWCEYQQQINNRSTTNQQQINTYKNVKNVKKIKKDPAQSAEVSAIIDLFKEVNPSYQRLFGMPPQRAAVERLLKTHGVEKLTSMITFLPKSNATKYAPTITTPVQFEARLGELVAWAQKQKTPINKPNIAFS